MSVIPFARELRRRRSENTYEAITYQLEHLYEQGGHRNLTLGDSRGLVLACAGHGQEADVLAAYAPLLLNCVDRRRRAQIFERIRAFIPDVSADTVDLRAFEVDGETLYLCALRQPGQRAHADLYRGVTGVRRILNTTAAVAA